MDFGLDCLVGSNQGSAPDAPPDPPEAELKVVVGSSGPFKRERPRSSVSGDDEEWRNSKLVNTDDFSIPKAMPKDVTRSNGVASLFWDAQHRQQMLSFSSSSSYPSNSHNASSALPYLRYAPLSYNSFAGFSSGNLNGGGSIRGVLTGTRGLFTRSQWMEFEHQALIYKYISANIHVPSNLLIPIKKAFDSAGFSCSPSRYLRYSPLGWGPFHLGFSNMGDPEPGRCRRTDGKKWRCSRDAIADQKYCEKHMNRGRHRSRKPVESQNGHPVTGTTTTAHASSRKMPVVTSALAAGGTAAAVAAPGCGASDSLSTMAHHQQHMNSFLHPGVLSADAFLERFFDDQESVSHKKQNPNSLSVISPSKDNPFPMMKQQSTYEEASRPQFDLDNSSLLNGLNKNSLLLDCRGFASSLDLAGILETDTPHCSARQFIDDWPENSVDRSDTNLTISIPMPCSELISAPSFPTNDKANLLPLRLWQKSDPLHVNLGVISTIFGEPIYKQNISWESSLGGPLGEVLHQTSNNTNNAESKNSSLLNLMNGGWDNSPSMGSSPRGVLQKMDLSYALQQQWREQPLR